MSVTIPGSIRSFGEEAFEHDSKLTSVIISNGVTSIGIQAFQYCSNLASIAIPNSVTNIDGEVFRECASLTNVTLSTGLTSMVSSFGNCSSLPQVTIPATITNIGEETFAECLGLKSVFFLGDAPTVAADAFDSDTNATVYYLPGTKGWSSNFASLPTVLWNPVIQTGNSSFGVQSNQFGFTITGTPNLPVLVQSSTNLNDPTWTPLQTFTLTNGLVLFSNSQWADTAEHFYSLAFPR
jgi:hypothetical protein